MEPFSIHTTLTKADWQAFQRVCALRMLQHRSFAKRLPAVAAWAGIAVVTCIVLTALELEFDLLSVIVGMALCIAMMVAAVERNVRQAQPREGSPLLSWFQYEFSAEGITSAQQGARSFREWHRVSDVTATSEHVFIWLDTLSAYLIPVRDLPAGTTAEQVVAACKEWMAVAAVTKELQPAPAVVPERQSSWGAAARLLTLRSVEHSARPSNVLSGKTSSIVVLALVALGLWTGLSWFQYLPEPTFIPYSMPALAWYVLAAVAVAGVMARRSHPQVALSQASSLIAMLLPVLIVADFAIARWIPQQWNAVANVLVGLYAIVFCARGLHALTGTRQPAAVLGGFAIAVMFLWVASSLYIYPAVWTSQDPEEYAGDVEVGRDASEALLFEQPARIDASVARIARATGEAPAGFFIGFAGFGDQRVFAQEIKFAARTFAERFDTADRTLFLINDRRDLQAQPLATVSGLRYALKAVASKMRLDRDVLFLALSSHGSEDPLLSVENGELPLRNLTGDGLAEALQASGIKWRVIVISACHAGAFIESLQNPYTVVITAASPDRTSFGCSDDRDLTYFGEAFFRDSLPQAASLREAFDTATKLVSEREAAEGFEASKPQAFFGEHIEPRLESMWRGASAP